MLSRLLSVQDVVVSTLFVMDKSFGVTDVSSFLDIVLSSSVAVDVTEVSSLGIAVTPSVAVGVTELSTSVSDAAIFPSVTVGVTEALPSSVKIGATEVSTSSLDILLCSVPYSCVVSCTYVPSMSVVVIDGDKSGVASTPVSVKRFSVITVDSTVPASLKSPEVLFVM